LLAGLAAGIERARNLRAAEGAVVEIAAIFARERNALRDAVVDDLVADFGKAVDVGLARAEIAALDGVVEEAIDGVAVVGIVLGGIDAALRGNGVRAARAVGIGEGLDFVAQLGHCRGGGGTGQSSANHDYLVLALVGRVDQLDLELVVRPLFGHRAVGYFGIKFHGVFL